MPIIRVLWPPVFAAQLLMLPARFPEEVAQPVQASGGLPIVYTVDGETIEVPLGTKALGWKPKPLRELAVELLEPPRPGDDIVGEDVEAAEIAPIPIRFRSYALKRECFDLWLFGDMAPERRMIWLLAAHSAKVKAARDRGISEAEEEKLILAGRGDIKRFFDRVEAHRPGFEEARWDLVEGRAFLRGLQPLAIEFQLGLHDFGSLFSKTLRAIEQDRTSKGAG